MDEKKGSKYTPGPWRITTDFEYIRKFDSSKHVEIQGVDGITIGCCLFDCLPEGRANARLIACAPELLEACKALLKFNEELCQDINVSIHYPSAEEARQVIRKAEGND